MHKKRATQWSIDNFLITGEQLVSDFQFSKTLEVILYPNAAKGSKIHLDFNKSGLKTIETYNISGKKLLTRKTHQKRYIENLSQFPNGAYFVRIEQNGNSVIKRFVIN